MDYIISGIRFKTKPETEQNGKILVEMIKDKQVIDTFKIHSGLSAKDELDNIAFIVLASYPSLSNTTGFSFKS
tara:strand:- start:50 stop:268 length:219 start_codon:yes stop_codon:yes gene_type:complete